MSQINKYTNIAQYNADTARSNDKSSVSQLQDTKEVLFDGVNVETTSPQCGDIMFHDGAKRVRFIKLDTYNAAQAPSDWVPMGVVAYREADKVAVVCPENTNNYKMMDVYRWNISGMILDGEQHNTTCKLNNVECGTFTYAATTKADFATQLNTWLATNATSFTSYIDLDDEERVILQFNPYSSHPSTTTMSGLTLTACNAEGTLTYGYRAVCRDGQFRRPLIHLERAKEYLRQDLNYTSYNPTSMISVNPAYPTCLPAYLGTSQYRDADYGVRIREKFGEGEEGWLNYIEQSLVDKRALAGMTAPKYRNSKASVEVLGEKMYLKADGTIGYLSPYSRYIRTFGFDGVQGCDKGDWQAPSLYDWIFIGEVIRLGLSGATADSDPLNRSLTAVGKRTISCAANFWLLPLCYDDTCVFAPSSGCAHESYSCSAYLAVPFLLYNLSGSEN